MAPPDVLSLKLEMLHSDVVEVKTALNKLSEATDKAAYRQALRDLPEQEGWPFNITWPTKPE